MSFLLKTYEDIINGQEASANKNIASIMVYSFLIFTVVYILDLINVFSINKNIMTIAYVLSAIFLLLPKLLNKKIGANNKSLKYIYLLFAIIFIFISYTTLSKHLVIVLCYPMAISVLYFNKKMTRFASFFTIISICLAELLNFKLGNLVQADYNIRDFHYLIYFIIIPRAFCLLGLAILFEYLTTMTAALLKKESDSMREVATLSNEMLLGYANLVESRDENTGGHIKRTSLYVELISEKLLENNTYSGLLDEEFCSNVIKAAPMHDIGKIYISDTILQKPSKLSEKEFDIMKNHTLEGGKIILNSFKNIENEKFKQIVYNVARSHHEKWNGKGYPDNLLKSNIPLEARIMAVADVFDAVSQKRCYRDALPLEECFSIIEKGSGTDFDPLIVDIFLKNKDKVIEIFKQTIE